MDNKFKFQEEAYSQYLVDEMFPLWKSHYDEIATFKDIPLEPDLKGYAHIAETKVLRIYTIRHETAGLIGYQVVFVRRNPHYMTSVQANSDILFLKPEFRHGVLAKEFIEWCDTQLKAEGVQVSYQHIKIAHDFSPLLKRIGYIDHDKTMARRLI